MTCREFPRSFGGCRWPRRRSPCWAQHFVVVVRAGDRLGVLGQVEVLGLGQVVRKRISAISCHALDQACGARTCAAAATWLPIRSRACVCSNQDRDWKRQSYADIATERPPQRFFSFSRLQDHQRVRGPMSRECASRKWSPTFLQWLYSRITDTRHDRVQVSMI